MLLFRVHIIYNNSDVLYLLLLEGKITKKMGKNVVCIRKSAIFAGEIAGEQFEITTFCLGVDWI